MSRPIFLIPAAVLTALLLFGGTSAQSASRITEDTDALTTYVDCPLERIGNQLVRCDNLTGAGVAAPYWIPEQK